VEKRPARVHRRIRLLHDRLPVALSGLPLVYALILGGVFHVINLPSFFGSNRKNSVKSSNAYAGLALVGFGSFTLIASLII